MVGSVRSGRVGAHVDINATIAHILGIDPPREWQGASLLSPQHPGRAYMLVDLSGYQFAVVDERFKYVLHYTDGFGRLYDLKADPLEQRDVSGEHGDVTAAMRARISAFVYAEERYLAGSPGARATAGRGGIGDAAFVGHARIFSTTLPKTSVKR